MKLVKYLPLVIVVALAACGEKKAPVGNDAATTSPPASATAPAVVVPATPQVATPAPATPTPATPAAAAPVASAADLAKGEQVYTANCLSCHGAALMGAPKFADKASWQPRIAKGIEVLYTNSLNGFNMMPAKGGNAALKDDEVKAAVDYMVNKAS